MHAALVFWNVLRSPRLSKFLVHITLRGAVLVGSFSVLLRVLGLLRSFDWCSQSGDCLITVLLIIVLFTAKTEGTVRLLIGPVSSGLALFYVIQLEGLTNLILYVEDVRP